MTGRPLPSLFPGAGLCYNSANSSRVSRRRVNVPARDTGKADFPMRRDSTPFALSPQEVSRFWQLVDRQANDADCWLWKGCRNGFGYGVITIRQRQFRAHRIAFMLGVGDIPPGDHHGTTCVCHRCDTRLCCNPSHLWLGSNADNSADRHAKGRDAIGDRNGGRLHPETRARGSRNGGSKLTEDDVYLIFDALATGETHRSIGKRFGVGSTTIDAINRGKYWSHLRRLTIAPDADVTP